MWQSRGVGGGGGLGNTVTHAVKCSDAVTNGRGGLVTKKKELVLDRRLGLPEIQC